MRFHDKYINIRIHQRDGRKGGNRVGSHTFKAFLTNFSENLKPTLNIVENKVLPNARNQYPVKYYMEISMELDLLAEDETEMVTNYASIKAITKHIVSAIGGNKITAGESMIDAVKKSLSEPTFEIEFNGFVHSGLYRGYFAQFDAKPDMEKGYWYGGDNLKQLYPKAYKVSLKFDSTAFDLDEPEYPWRSAKAGGAAGAPKADARLEGIREVSAKVFYHTSAAQVIRDTIVAARGPVLDRGKLKGSTAKNVIREYNSFKDDDVAGSAKTFKQWFEGHKAFFTPEAIAYIETVELRDK